MKVGILSQYYLPEIGAPQARLSSLARRLRDRGHDVVVLAAMPNYPGGRLYPGYRGFSRIETVDGIRVIRSWIIPSKEASMRKRLTSYLSFAFSSLIVGTRRLPRLDYLITESPPLVLGPTGIALARLKRARWILNVSDLWPDSVATLGVTRSGLVLNAARMLERFCYRHAWMVTGQTAGIVRAVIKRAPSTRTRHFSNGVDLALFGESFDNARRSDAPCTFVYAGLHGLAQGLDRIVEAAALLDPRDHVRFDFVGDGPTKDALIDQAVRLGVSYMRFLDPVPHDRIPKLLAGADVVIVPLKLPIEGAIPSKLYEAMAAGAAVLLVADGEPAGLLAEAGAGITVQPGHAAEIADAMRRLIADPVARVCMGQRGRTFVRRFDRGRINDELVSVLEAELRA